MHIQLARFLEKHPDDVISLATALQACCVWVDIESHPTKFLEGAFGGSNKPLVPSLGQVIGYFPVYLAFTERHGLIEYPHLFRFFHEAYTTDVAKHASFKIDSGVLDEAQMRGFVAQARARASWVNPEDRITVLPADMIGSELQTVAGACGRSEAEMAVAGMGTIHQNGSPNSRSVKVQVAIPKQLAVHYYKRREDTPTTKNLLLAGGSAFDFFRTEVSFFGACTDLSPMWEFDMAMETADHTQASPEVDLADGSHDGMQVDDAAAQYEQ